MHDPTAGGTEPTQICQKLPWEKLVPGSWVTRGEGTLEINRTSSTEGHFSKIEKHNTQNTIRKLDKMMWQKNMFKMMKQDKTAEEQLSEVDIGNLHMKEF